MALVHNGVKAFKCQICDNSYGLKSTLDQHILRAHDGKKRFHCEKCDSKSFTTKGDLNRHILWVHEKEKKRPFNCDKYVQ